MAHLRTLYTRENILRDHGVVEPYPFSARDSDSEVFGRDLPPKTVVLTFDDGPHKAYTEEIVAILKRYDVPGVFFEVGRNLGSVDAAGKAQLAPLSKISHTLMEEGYVVGNHSLTHAQLSKTTGDALRRQVLDTDMLLRAVDDNTCAAVPVSVWRTQCGRLAAAGRGRAEIDHVEHRLAGLGRPGARIHRAARARSSEQGAARHRAVP
ncbi:UNVERIFIED_ORG: peptidoglycan/xylan/chitin deacetylase (PgdA/CDA1 family) [Xanthomonas axonopodis]